MNKEQPKMGSELWALMRLKYDKKYMGLFIPYDKKSVNFRYNTDNSRMNVIPYGGTVSTLSIMNLGDMQGLEAVMYATTRLFEEQSSHEILDAEKIHCVVLSAIIVKSDGTALFVYTYNYRTTVSNGNVVGIERTVDFKPQAQWKSNKPITFDLRCIPYENMQVGTASWLPIVLAGHRIHMYMELSDDKEKVVAWQMESMRKLSNA